MEKLYRGIRQLIVETDDIENISQAVLEDLEIGDMVVAVESGEKTQFVVNYKDDETTGLIFADENVVKTIYFAKSEEGEWYFDSENITSLSEIADCAKVHKTNDDFDTLPTDFINQLKLGDIVYSDAQANVALVLYYDVDQVELVDTNSNHFVYILDVDTEEWELTSQANVIINTIKDAIDTDEISVGTKLYQHSIEINQNALIFINEEPNAYTNSNFASLILGVFCSGANMVYYDDSEGIYGGVLCVGGSDSSFKINYYSYVNDNIVHATINVSQATIVDTISPL